MPNKTLLQEMDGTPKQIVLADHSSDYGPTAANDLRKTTDGSQETDVQIALASVSDGAARQSAKFDFGVDRAPAYSVRVALELNSTGLTAGEFVELYNAPSHSSVAANANPGGVSGSDSAYSGYASNLAASVKQLQFVGSVVVTADASTVVQIADSVGVFSPPERYGTLVVKNESGAAFHSDDVEIHIVFDPIVPELQ